MRVRIISYEDVDAWILGKFAVKLKENLIAIGVDADISKTPDPTADINHHIIYFDYDGKKNSIDTVFITHIDSLAKRDLLKSQLKNAPLGICMSEQTMLALSDLGIPRDRLAFINPAHDSIIKPKPEVIGLTCRVQEDGRKRENFLAQLAQDIDPAFFEFKIMGDGWDTQIEYLQKKGFKVEYIDHFIYDKYIELIPSLDYYLYMGQDEGQMGFIDALSAGVKTIVTPQGYHLDAKGGITHSFNTYNDLRNIFFNIAKARQQLINSVNDWNWRDYAKKHKEVWEYLILKEKGDINNSIRSQYYDGLNSMKEFSIDKKQKKKKLLLYFNLFKGDLLHAYYQRKANFFKIYNSNGVKGVAKKIISKLIFNKNGR